jgi:hypothetical protein
MLEKSYQRKAELISRELKPGGGKIGYALTPAKNNFTFTTDNP